MKRLRACALAVTLTALFGSPAHAAPWTPPPGTTWQIQYSGTLDTSHDVDMYDVDMFDTTADQVATIHAIPAKAVCYIDAGSWENWRPDHKRYPKRVLGRPLAGWPGERWLDIRQLRTLAPIVKARVAKCKDKGFDGVDFDNVEGYKARTGFPLTGRNQLAFNKFLAKIAHDAGLSVGLKNDLGQIPKLVDRFDFAVNEQCVQYAECKKVTPFIGEGKAVFNIEYQGDMTSICNTTLRLQLSTLKKNRNLDDYAEACP